MCVCTLVTHRADVGGRRGVVGVLTDSRKAGFALQQNWSNAIMTSGSRNQILGHSLNVQTLGHLINSLLTLQSVSLTPFSRFRRFRQKTAGVGVLPKG